MPESRIKVSGAYTMTYDMISISRIRLKRHFPQVVYAKIMELM